jgi:anhydro-N-acetylmuramic acid kinase
MSADGILSNGDLFIGLMSGTSLDSIDAALVNLKDNHFQLIDSLNHNIPAVLRQQLIALCEPGDNEIDRLGTADRELAKEFAKATNLLLLKAKKNKSDITAIGSHGQTIRHRPNIKNSFTLQIGDPNTLAFETGITTIADFRRKDIAAGGQGAPLAPAFHQAAFGSAQQNRAIINIGGMANITYLEKNGSNLGFDTGPGNILMDGWIQKHLQKNYDHDGQWAASGSVDQPLLTQLLNHPYLKKAKPKSTGREDFNQQWLGETIKDKTLSTENIQATLLEFTAQTIYSEIHNLPSYASEIYICGGGAYNKRLMQRLEILTRPRTIANTAMLGIPAEWVEAAAFAWLAKQTLERKTGNLCSVTGATTEQVLGAIYYS